MNKNNNLHKLVDNELIRRAIISSEEVTRENIMTKRERIINNHINTVYPIHEYTTGGNRYYYTKLNPKDKFHNGRISSKSYENLCDKIIAYYLELEINAKTTVWDVLIAALEDSSESTVTRHKQVFNKNFSSIKNKKITELSEQDIRNCLQQID